ncbi:MAG: YhdP family protein [Burkholderiaceae bacterium]
MPDQPQPTGTPAAPISSVSGALQRAETLEHEVEQALEAVVERGQRSLAARFGLGFARGTLRVLRAAFILLLVAYFLFGAVLLATRWWVLPRIDEFRPAIERIASQTTGTVITIGQIQAGWNSLNPHFSLEQVRIASRAGHTGLVLPRLEATLSWTSLLRASPSFVWLQVESPELTVRRLADGRFEVAGFEIDPAQPSGDTRLLDWLLRQNRIVITGARLDYVDQRLNDSPRQLQLNHLDLRFESGLTGWSFGLQAVPPPELAAPFDLRGRFTHPPFEAAANYRLWKGEVYAGFDDVDLARLNAWLELPVQLNAARGAARTWIDFDRMQVTRVSSDLALTDVDLRLAPALDPLQLTYVRGRLSQSRRDTGEEFGATGLEFRTRAGLVFGPAQLELKLVAASATQPASADFSANHLALDALSALLPHLPLGASARAAIERHHVSGELADLKAQWRGPLAAPLSYSVKAGFTGLDSRPLEASADQAALPGFSNLSGQIEASQTGGSLKLASRDATLEFPGIFEDPRLAFSELKAALSWSAQPQFEVRIESASARNADAEATASGSWRNTGGAGTVDLAGRVLRLEAAAAHKYIPLVAGANTVTWLAQALRAGRASEGNWRLRGRLADFPFTRPAQGDFRVTAHVAGVELDYVPSGRRDAAGHYVASELWPALKDIDGSLLFDRAALEVRASRAQATGLQLSHVVARIPSLAADARVLAEGKIAGPLEGMVRFTNTSPVGGWLGHFLEGADARGPARLDLKLDIPLAHASDTKVAGTLHLQGNDLVLAGGVPPLTRASGPISFTETSVQSPGVNLGFLGGAGKLEIATQPDSSIVLSAHGRLSAAGLRASSDNVSLTRLLERIQGETRYSAALTLRGSAMTLRADSDLVGLALNLPPPLKKSAAEAWPLRIARLPTVAGGVETDEIRISLATLLDATFERQRRGKQMQMARGSIAVGDTAALPAYGVSLNANLKRFDLDAWLPAIDGLTSLTPSPRRGNAAGGDEFKLDLVALRAREVVVDGKTFDNVVLGASQTPDGSWNANIASDLVSGALNWHPSTATREARLSARFTRLILPDSARADVTKALDSAAPSRLPSIEISADDFAMGTRRLGRLEIAAVNAGAEQGAAWKLQKLSLTNPDAKLNASGQWAPEAGGGPRKMSLALLLEIQNAGGLLDRLGIKGALKGGEGKIEGDLSWRGSPLSVNYPSLDGKLALELGHGQFLKIEPGAARLLSLFSLQSITRRLSLDFRDIFAEGFAFDAIRADATLAAGVLTTRNFHMGSAVATVLIDGSANLRNETQNLHLLVLPDINSASASIALAFANPALGLGSYLAQMVLKDPLAKLFSLEYDVTGTWSDPQVKKLDRSLMTPRPTPTIP